MRRFAPTSRIRTRSQRRWSRRSHGRTNGARRASGMRPGSRGAPAARPSFTVIEQPSETLRRVLDVAFDTSPLALSRAGTARYVNGLLAGLRGRADVRVERHAFGLRPRAAVPARDVGWYLGALPLLARGAD